MASYPVMVEGDDGYCDWVQPEMDGYKLACCDCGLVHKMQFKVVVLHEDKGNGYKVVEEAEPGKFLVQFRASRDSRATGQIRRRRGRKV
jgi:hypothetical protein